MTPYEVLGVSKDATIEEVRAAYVRSARSSHPDLPGGSDTAMQRVNEAWAVLSNPARRADFDLTARRAQEARARATPPTSNGSTTGPGRGRRTTAPRNNVSADGRMKTQESAPAWKPPPSEDGHASLLAMVPLTMMVIGGFIAMAGAAFGAGAMFALGTIVVLLGAFGLLIVPMLRLTESRRSDGPQ